MKLFYLLLLALVNCLLLVLCPLSSCQLLAEEPSTTTTTNNEPTNVIEAKPADGLASGQLEASDESFSVDDNSAAAPPEDATLTASQIPSAEATAPTGPQTIQPANEGTSQSTDVNSIGETAVQEQPQVVQQQQVELGQGPQIQTSHQPIGEEPNTQQSTPRESEAPIQQQQQQQQQAGTQTADGAPASSQSEQPASAPAQVVQSPAGDGGAGEQTIDQSLSPASDHSGKELNTSPESTSAGEPHEPEREMPSQPPEEESPAQTTPEQSSPPPPSQPAEQSNDPNEQPNTATNQDHSETGQPQSTATGEEPSVNHMAPVEATPSSQVVEEQPPPRQQQISAPAAEREQPQSVEPHQPPTDQPAEAIAPIEAPAIAAPGAVATVAAEGASGQASNPPSDAGEEARVGAEPTEKPVEEEKSDESVEQKVEPSAANYQLDVESCKSVSSAHLNSTISQIMTSILGLSNCLGQRQFKLKPASNKLISGFVVEVGSMPLNLARLTSSSVSRISCVQSATSRDKRSEETNEIASTGAEKPGETKELNKKVVLNVDQELEDISELVSRWRLHKSLHQEDIPMEIPAASHGSNSNHHLLRSSRNRLLISSIGYQNGDKCQPFRLDGGTFDLHLLSMKTRLVFEAQLGQLGEGGLMAAKPKDGGSIELVDFGVRELYIDHEVRLDTDDKRQPLPVATNKGKRSLGEAPSRLLTNSRRRVQPTTSQILHDNNNHHRRNNWLLDMYGNWLKHEYRGQLRTLFARDGPLLEQLNYCLIN